MTSHQIIEVFTWLVVHGLYGLIGGLFGGLVGRVLAGKPGDKWGFLCGFPLAVAGVIPAEAIFAPQNAKEMLPVGSLVAVACGLIGGVLARVLARRE